VHDGHSPFGFNLYPDGETVRGNWQCLSDHCHHHFPATIIGFTRGVLSNYNYGWRQKGDRCETHRVAVDYVLDFLGYDDIRDVEVDYEKADLLRFNARAEFMNRRPVTGLHAVCDRERFRSEIDIPASYYIDRGYSKSILDKYDVGLCTNPRSPMCNRVAVPFYDPTHSVVIGVLGRSTLPQCSRCRLFHDRSSPCSQFGDSRYAKWRVSQGFNDKHHLYGYWFSAGYIAKSRCVVLVEGPGDIWRLEEAGIHNAVALLGSSLHDSQKIILESCSADDFVVITDNDPAGDQAEAAIRQACSTYGRVHRIRPIGKDVGEMTVDEVRNHILPTVMSKTKRISMP
jgi:5S rRNA maturation endonuclease (ribonuclease M5)